MVLSLSVLFLQICRSHSIKQTSNFGSLTVSSIWFKQLLCHCCCFESPEWKCFWVASDLTMSIEILEQLLNHRLMMPFVTPCFSNCTSGPVWFCWFARVEQNTSQLVLQYFPFCGSCTFSPLPLFLSSYLVVSCWGSVLSEVSQYWSPTLLGSSALC